jgi:hypothetical protein
MTQLNLGLAAYGVALAAHRLADSVAFSWFFVGFSLAVTAIIMLKFENGKNATSNQLNLLLCLTLSLFGGVMAWL